MKCGEVGETGVPGVPIKRTGQSESLLCENSLRKGRNAPRQRSLGYFCCRDVAISAREDLVCARGGERRVASVLDRESFSGTAVEELEDVQVEVDVDWRDGWRGCGSRSRREDCIDFGCDFRVFVECDDGGVVESDDADSRLPLDGGRTGDTRIPESAFVTGIGSYSSSTDPTADQKVVRLDVLPPAVLGVLLLGMGVACRCMCCW